MGYSPITFGLASPDARRQHLQEAHGLLRAAIAHRNQSAMESNDTGPLDLETTMRLEALYADIGVQWFAERWGPLFKASPVPLALLSPEEFLKALYPKGTHLLFSYGEKEEADDLPHFPDLEEERYPAQKDSDDLFPRAVPYDHVLENGLREFWPHPISAQQIDPVDRADLASSQTIVVNWRYLWFELGSEFEPGWLFHQVKSGLLKPAAVFVRTDGYGSEMPCLLMPCNCAVHHEALEEVLNSLPEELADEWGDDSLEDLVPLPWRQDEYRLVYLNPPAVNP